MLFTQFNLEDAKKIWYEEAFEDGEERGENLQMIKLVQRKLQKGKTPEVIAEELDEPIENVELICEAANKCGLEADAMEIFEEMQIGVYREATVE